MNSTSCIFCKIINGHIKSTIVLETPLVLVIKDIQPKAPTHNLILPKKHLTSLLDLQDSDADLCYEMLKVARDLGKQLTHPQAFNIISNNGAAAGQSVPHLHWHFLAGKNLYESGFEL